MEPARGVRASRSDADRPPSEPGEPDATADGRLRRSQRTRAAIVEAVVDLVLAGIPEPTAPQVADRAGVSVRTVYGHFASIGDLHRAVVDHVTGLVIQRLAVIDPTETTAAKIDLLCGQRSRINEELGPLLLAARRLAGGSPELAATRTYGRAASLGQVGRVFAPELAALDEGSRGRRIASIHALLQVEAWMELRREAGLDLEQARLATREAVAALVPG